MTENMKKAFSQQPGDGGHVPTDAPTSGKTEGNETGQDGMIWSKWFQYRHRMLQEPTIRDDMDGRARLQVLFPAQTGNR